MENLTYSNSYSHHRQHNRKYVSRRSKRRVRLWVFAVPLLVFVLHFSWDDSFASANSNHQSNLTVNDTSNNVDDADDNNQACQMNSASSMTDWNLMLVNPWHSIPPGYEVALTQLSNGHDEA